MNNSKLFRTAGWCALASAICLPLAMVSFLLSGSAPSAGMLGMVFEILSLLLLVYVFYALSVAHWPESSWLGIAGTIIMVVAIVVDLISQQVKSNFLFGLWYLLYSLPYLIFGYLGLRSTRMPRIPAVLALLGGVISFVGGVLYFLGNPGLADSIQSFSILFMLVWAVWVWRVLWSRKFAAASPEPAAAVVK
jgi:hypothetical protein